MSIALTVTAPAKLNLFLHITGRRPTATTTCRPCFSCWTGATPSISAPTTPAELTLDWPDLGFDPAENLILRRRALRREGPG